MFVVTKLLNYLNATRMRSLFIISLLMVFLLNADCYAVEKPVASITSNEGKRLEITVTYERQQGVASNQYAIWIEDASGKITKTLYVTKFTAEGGYNLRPSCTPVWVKKANPKEMTGEHLDSFTGATPQSGSHTYTWDFTDSEGAPVPAGEYTFIVEGNLYDTSCVTFKGKCNIGSAEIKIIGEPTFSSDDPKNKSMLTAVIATYYP